MAVQEEPASRCFDVLQGAPACRVQDGDPWLCQVWRSKHATALVFPYGSGSRARRSVELQLGDLSPGVEMYHLTVSRVASRPDRQAVRLVEKKSSK